MKARKVLIVDDEQFIINYVTDLLTAYGYTVITARNGKDAPDVLKRELPDIIVSDVMMPEMDGFTFLTKVQENRKTRDIPFLFLSAKSQVDDRVKGLQIGADDYISKPFDHEEFLARIEVRLNKKDNLLFSDSVHSNEINGDLSVFSLVDIVQILKMRKLTGELTLTFANDTAILRINNGNLVQIHFKDLQPSKAFQFLMDRRQGLFAFLSSDAEYEDEIVLDTEHFLLDAMKQYDDYQRIIAELPPLHQIWKKDDIDLKGKRLSKEAQSVFQQFDGTQSFQEIIESFSDEDQKVLVIIRNLIRNGLLKPTLSVYDKTSENSREKDMMSGIDELRQSLIRLIDTRSGNASFVVVSDDEETMNRYIATLSSCLGINDESSSSASNSFSIKKPMIDTRYGIHIYGLVRFEQFSFVRKIMANEMLGIFFLITSTSNLSEDHPVRACIRQARQEEIPSLVVIPEDKQTADMEEILESSGHVACQVEDKDSVFKTFSLLMKKVMMK